MSPKPEPHDSDRRLDRFLNDLRRLDHPDPPPHLADRIVRNVLAQGKGNGLRYELLRLAAGVLFAVAAYAAWTSFEGGLDVGPLMNTAGQVVDSVNDSLSAEWIGHFLRF